MIKAFGFVFLLAMGTFATFAPASANQRCDTGNNACASFWKQMYQSEVAKNRGGAAKVVAQKKRTVKATTVSTGGGHGTVCVYARVRKQSSTSAVVLYVGGYSARNSGQVLKTWGSDGWKAGPGGYYKRLCLDGDLIAGKTKVTICGIDGHNTWSSSDIKYLLRAGTIGMGDPADMFGGGRSM